LIAMYAIYYSHRQQVVDKAAMREGVERDRERLRSMRKSGRVCVCVCFWPPVPKWGSVKHEIPISSPPLDDIPSIP
jgi:hypothetical protein